MSDYVFSKEIDEIMSIGFWLKDAVGVNEWAFTKDEAISVVTQLKELNIPVLGGDVYEIREGRPHPIGENWSCNQEHDEPFTQFVERSASKATDYLTRYPTTAPDSHKFVVVPGV